LGFPASVPACEVVALLAVSLPLWGCGRVGYDLVRGSSLQSRTDAAAGADAASGAGARHATDGGGMQGSEVGTAPVPCAAVVQGVSDECTEVPALSVPPFIDGLPECGLPLYLATPQGFDGDAAAVDAVASYGVAWRPNGVYFFIRVTDPTAVPPDGAQPASYGDGIELFVDADGSFAAPPAYDDPGTRRFVIAAPNDATTPAARGEVWSGSDEIASSWESRSFRAYPKSFGYVVEAFIGATDLGLSRLDLVSGSAIAWDVAIDVSFPTPAETGSAGHRLGRYLVRGGPTSPETDVRAFCRANLLWQ